MGHAGPGAKDSGVAAGFARGYGGIACRRSKVAAPFPPSPGSPMTNLAKTSFARPGKKATGTVVVLAGEGAKLGPLGKGLGIEALVAKIAATADFKAKAMAG